MTHPLLFKDVRAPIHGDVMGGPWSFSLEAGSFMAMEASPSVADTVARLCVGFAEASSGQVAVLGEDPASLPRRRLRALLARMGVAFHREGLVSNLTLEANLVVPLVFGSGLPPAEAGAAAAEAMAELGLEGYRARRPATLTREARVLGALARAALRRPELLVLEQLTAGLPDDLAARALAWCRARAGSILVLVPGPSRVLDRMSDGWLPPLTGAREEEQSS